MERKEPLKISSDLQVQHFERLLNTVLKHPASAEREKMLKELHAQTKAHPQLQGSIQQAIIKNNAQQGFQRIQEESQQAVRTVSINQETEKRISDAASLLNRPRTLDNSSFKGRVLSHQENETLDLIEILKRNLANDKQALAKINSAASVQEGKPGIGPLRGCEVVARTEQSAILLKGRHLYVYSLKLLDLEPNVKLETGQTLDLAWARGNEKATIRRARGNENTNTRQIDRGRKTP